MIKDRSIFKKGTRGGRWYIVSYIVSQLWDVSIQVYYIFYSVSAETLDEETATLRVYSLIVSLLCWRSIREDIIHARLTFLFHFRDRTDVKVKVHATLKQFSFFFTIKLLEIYLYVFHVQFSLIITYKSPSEKVFDRKVSTADILADTDILGMLEIRSWEFLSSPCSPFVGSRLVEKRSRDKYK